MSSDKKNSTARAILNVVLLVFLGAFVVSVYFVFKPARQVAALPTRPDSGVVYFVEGKTHAAAKNYWAEKRRKINSGQPYDIGLREQELNAWMASGFKAENAGSFALLPDVPNFRVADGEIQMAIPFKVVLFGKAFPLILQTRGKIVREAGGFVFKADKTYAGSLPLHFFGDALVSCVSGLIEPESGVRDAWGRLSEVEINGNILRLVSP